MDNVQQELAEARSEMDLIPELDRGAIERLRAVKAEIKDRRAEVDATRKTQTRLARSINATMVSGDGANHESKGLERCSFHQAKFDPAVTTLVETVGAKFSSSFERKQLFDLSV